MLVTILPNCLGPLIVQATLSFSSAILDAAETEQYRQFEAVRAEKGLSAAIRWREGQFE